MDTKNRPQNNENSQAQPKEEKTISNPFTDHKSAEEDIRNAKEELEKEQKFKEVQTERD